MHKIMIAVTLLVFTNFQLKADDWPQWRGPDRDGTWSEDGVLDEFPLEKLEIKWRVPINSGYTGPTVADGRVFVMDRIVRPRQGERILCVDEQTGDQIWKHEYDCEYRDIGYQAGPRACVTVHQGSAYALGAMGHLHCLQADTGKLIWEKDLNKEYAIQVGSRDENRMPMWGIAASPVIYRNLVILHIGGRNGACVVGLDQQSGVEVWRALDDRAQYSTPILIRQAGQDVVVVWTGDSVAGLNPANGKVHWRIPMTPRNMPIGIATPIVKGNRLFVTSFYDGAMMIALDAEQPTATKLWHRVGRDENDTEALHSIISTPIWLGESIYGVDSYGELRCIAPETGDRIWEDLSATPKARWSTIHFVQNGDNTWMFNERGELLIGRLSPDGFHEISRASLISPTLEQLRRRNGVCWSHPAYANRHVFARNDEELVCASLAE